MKKDSFIFHREWYEVLNGLSDSVRLEVFNAILSKVFGDNDVKLSIEGTMAMRFISLQIDKDFERYNEICERRKSYGRAGGLAKASKSYQKLANGSKSKQKVASVADNNIQDTNVSMSIDNHNNKEKDTDVSKKKTKSTFVPPTLEEVDAYIKEKGFHFNAKDFIDYYEADDWHYGKDRQKVSNWKRCCLTWEKKRKNDYPSFFGQETDVTNEQGETMVIPPEWNVVGEDGRHYETYYDMTRQQNSYEEYFEQYGNYK